jgi:hypothetical protein
MAAKSVWIGHQIRVPAYPQKVSCGVFELRSLRNPQKIHTKVKNIYIKKKKKGTYLYNLVARPICQIYVAFNYYFLNRPLKEKALDCALRKKAALFRDAICAIVLELEVALRATFANHPRMVRYGFVQLKRAQGVG